MPEEEPSTTGGNVASRLIDFLFHACTKLLHCPCPPDAGDASAGDGLPAEEPVLSVSGEEWKTLRGELASDLSSFGRLGSAGAGKVRALTILVIKGLGFRVLPSSDVMLAVCSSSDHGSYSSPLF